MQEQQQNTKKDTVISTASIDSFLSWLSGAQCSRNTLRSYRGDLSQFMIWMDESGLTPSDWQEMETAAQSWLRAKGQTWSIRTVRRRLATLKTWGKWAGNPAFMSNFRAPRAAAPTPHPLPEGMPGVEALLAGAAGDDQLRALIGLCGLCGLRVHEARSVRFEHIDADEMLLTIVGKGHKERIIPISQRAFEVIAPAALDAMNRGRPLVRMSDASARAKITALGQRVGLSKRVASHDLRSTFATSAYDACQDIRAVQYLLGHSSVETTTGYVAPHLASMRGAVNALGNHGKG